MKFKIAKSFTNILICGALISVVIACGTSKKGLNALDKIQEPNVQTTLEKAFQAMGGLENWQNITSLQFRKKTILYLANGEVEKASDQMHLYENKPNQKVQIRWETNQEQHEIEMIGASLVKKVNQKIDDQANVTSLKNTVLAATFVMGVPFKLMDEGAALSYDGIHTMLNGKEVHTVKAIYNPDQYANHSKSDIWWHYFDKDTYEQVGYKIAIHDHNSYIENLTFERVDGFLFTTSRKSWRVNEKGEKLYLRAAYEYSDFEVK